MDTRLSSAPRLLPGKLTIRVEPHKPATPRDSHEKGLLSAPRDRIGFSEARCMAINHAECSLGRAIALAHACSTRRQDQRRSLHAPSLEL